MKKTVRLWSLLLVVLSLVLGMTACGGNAESSKGQTETTAGQQLTGGEEFVFTGFGTFQRSEQDLARDLDITITGYKSDGSVVLKVAQMPQIEYTGRWVLVENKGYKIYFDDADATFVYVRYNPETGVHTFHYPCNFGTVGTTNVEFTYADSDFSYDGIGLGLHPPVISGISIKGLTNLTCNEDGTLVAGSRTGTWEYLEKENVYHFHFDLDTDYQESYKLDEWDKNTGDFGHDGDFEWQIYDYSAAGFGGTNATRIDSVTLMPCGIDPADVTIDEETGRHTFTSVQGHTMYYVVDESGQPNFFNEVYSTYDEATGEYTIDYSTKGFMMVHATFTTTE